MSPMPPPAAWQERLWLWLLGHHGLGGDEKPSNGRGILQCGTYHLGRIDHALLDEITILSGLSVVTERIIA